MATDQTIGLPPLGGFSGTDDVSDAAVMAAIIEAYGGGSLSGTDDPDIQNELFEEIIAMHSNPEDMENYIGTREEVIELLTPATMEEITVTEKPPFGYRALSLYDDIIDEFKNITDKKTTESFVTDPENTIGITSLLSPGIETINENIIDPIKKYAGPVSEYYGITDTLENFADTVNERFRNAGDAVKRQLYEIYGNEPWFEGEYPVSEPTFDTDKLGIREGGISGLDPDDIPNAGNLDIDDQGNIISTATTDGTDSGTTDGTGDETGEETVEGEDGGIKGMLSKAYDKLGIQGILGILSLLGLGQSIGQSGREDSMGGGGIGSFSSGQFDPYGLGATANYGAMPGGGVGQPMYLPNTNAPIYYPFASEVTKQYNAQQGGPFSFTAGPPPGAMIQNLTSQRIPGVQYVAEGKFIRRNGLTEGPGTETSDDIPAMLSDGEFVTNAEANRGIGAMALLNQGMPKEVAMDPEQQRLAGARQMYLQQAMGQQLAKQMRNR